jgi:hypothetical protein
MSLHKQQELHPVGIGVPHGVFKKIEDGCMLPALWMGLFVAHLQGVHLLGMTGPDETLGRPWPPRAICLIPAAMMSEGGHATSKAKATIVIIDVSFMLNLV